MKAALSNFYKTKRKFDTYKTVLIIGDMLELGQNAKEMHLELIPMIKKINPDVLITIGAYSKKISDKLDVQMNCNSFLTMPPLIEKITQFIKPNQLILIKGSNGTGLWKLIPIFKNLNQEKRDVA